MRKRAARIGNMTGHGSRRGVDGDEGHIVVAGVVQLIGTAGDQAARTAIILSRGRDRVFPVVAGLPGWQPGFPIAEHAAVLAVRKRAAVSDQLPHLRGLGRKL